MQAVHGRVEGIMKEEQGVYARLRSEGWLAQAPGGCGRSKMFTRCSGRERGLASERRAKGKRRREERGERRRLWVSLVRDGSGIDGPTPEKQSEWLLRRRSAVDDRRTTGGGGWRGVASSRVALRARPATCLADRLNL